MSAIINRPVFFRRGRGGGGGNVIKEKVDFRCFLTRANYTFCEQKRAGMHWNIDKDQVGLLQDV